MSSFIRTRNLSKYYLRGSEKIKALQDVSIDLPQGKLIAIVGPSGSGKTTLLNLLGCLDHPSNGSIFINNIEVSGLSEHQLVNVRRQNIGFVFQQFFLLPTLSVRENIALPLLFLHHRDENETVDKIMETVGLSSRASHLPHQLSGGEMQRVSIGRALINNPRIIMADEPTGNLDSTTAHRIIHLFQELCARGISIIIVTHNMELAEKSDGMIYLKDGSIAHVSDNLLSSASKLPV